MSLSDTSALPYKDRNFIIDPSDKELFVKMKSIVDSGFPEAVSPMLLDLYKLCWEKHKRIEYKEVGYNTIYIHFPRLNPIMRFIGGILLFFSRFRKEEDEEEEEDEL